MATILVAEDDDAVGRILDRYLKRCGHRMLHVTSVAGAFESLRRESDIALILLDCGLTDGDGIQVCRHIKRNPATNSIPVIVMTGMDVFDEEVRSYEAGADLYLAKPLDYTRLERYVTALLNRPSRRDSRLPILSWGDLTIDSEARTVAAADQIIRNLPARQFALLYLLISYQGRLVSRFTIIRKLWRNAVRDREVDVTVCRLRRRLGSLGRDLIEPVPGQGYRLMTPVPVKS